MKITRRNLLKTAIAIIATWPASSFARTFMSINLYLDEFNALPSIYKRKWGDPLIDGAERKLGLEYLAVRTKLVTKYSWAVPTDEAIDEIVRFVNQSIVDFGAGSGYWAGLLADRGIDVKCIDNWTDPKPDMFFHGVETGSFELLKQYKKRPLMLVWPPRAVDVAVKAMRMTESDKLIYVGEGSANGIARGTANNEFFTEARRNWKVVKAIRIPQWYNRNDAVFFLERI